MTGSRFLRLNWLAVYTIAYGVFLYLPVISWRGNLGTGELLTENIGRNSTGR